MTLYDKRRSVLARAARAALYFGNDGDKARGGAGDGKQDTADKSDDAKRDAGKAGDADKQQSAGIAEDEVQRRIDAALDEADRKRAAKEQKAEDDRKAEEAKQRGDFEALETKLKADIAARELDIKRRDVKDAIGDYLREHHKTYAGTGVEKYILPQVAFDAQTSDDDVANRVKAAADQYVTDNPRGDGKPAGGAPPRQGERQRGAAPGGGQARHPRINPYTTPASRF